VEVLLLVEPSAADIPPQDEQEGFEHGMDKTLQKELTRDASGDDTVVEANAPSGGGVLAHASASGSTEEGAEMGWCSPLNSPSSWHVFLFYFFPVRSLSGI
jgi:hypothetical protein